MSASLERLAILVSQEAASEFDESLRKIEHCVNQLTDEQVWWRPSESMNSIANLLLHLCGNVGQWVVSGVGGSADTRQRQQEFDDRSATPKEELLQQIESVVADAKRVLLETSAEELLQLRLVQGNEVTGVRAIIHSLAHFQGHVQEIVHLTRCQLGESYQFDFVAPVAKSEDDG